MAFRTNTSKANEGNFPLKPEGDYEVIVDAADVDVNKNGKESIKLVYVIRNDVTQACQNELIFHSIWKKSDDKQNDDDRSIGGFNFGQLMALVEAASLPDGKEYATLDDLLSELIGKAIKVHLYHDDYNDKWYEKIDRHMSTDFPKVKHKAKNPAKNAPTAQKKSTPAHRDSPAVPSAPVTAAVSETDDDYPF